MQPIKVFIYPDRDFKITDFGAVPGGEVDNTKAIAAAIDACIKRAVDVWLFRQAFG